MTAFDLDNLSMLAPRRVRVEVRGVALQLDHHPHGQWPNRRPDLRLIVAKRRLRPVAKIAAAVVVPPLLAVCLVAIPAILTVSAVKPVVNLARSYTSLQLPPAKPMPSTTYVYDRNGKLLTTFHAGVNRTPVPLSKISINLQNAVIAVEDRNFYHEGALSLTGIVRAALVNAKAGSIEEGGSTVTQQYVKNTYTGDERTIKRKLREAVLATKLARKLTKKQILGLYLNSVYFGHGAYGAEAAALTYFDKPASDLSIAQAAMLAGTINAPALYDPYLHRDAARARRDVVLADLAAQGYITSQKASALVKRPVRVHAGRSGPTPAAYFVDVAKRELEARYGVDRTFNGGLQVQTTLDSAMQHEAEQAIADRLKLRTDPAAALVAMDPRNGQILALVGGRNFTTAKFNLATMAHRQAGSAFKPFTLATAMMQGIDPNATMVGPHDLVVDKPECLDPSKSPPAPWNVANAADGEAGTFSLLDATAFSVNTIFAQLVVDVGPENVVRTARRMGISSPLAPVCSITLGTQGVTPLEMTRAYSTFADGGIRHNPESLLSVKSSSGRSLLKFQPQGTRAIPEQVADDVTYALEGVVQKGTGTAANFGRPIAGKTGTAENYQDAWFCGYTPQLATCVWMGYPKTEDRSMVDVEGVPEVFGGTLPAEIWHDFMEKATRGMPVIGFDPANFDGMTKQPDRLVQYTPPAPVPQPSLPPPPKHRCHPPNCNPGH
jgi:penicillin-binding protein 1A